MKWYAAVLISAAVLSAHAQNSSYGNYCATKTLSSDGCMLCGECDCIPFTVTVTSWQQCVPASHLSRSPSSCEEREIDELMKGFSQNLFIRLSFRRTEGVPPQPL